jgi:fructose-1,6-bisphosphatase
VQDQHSTASLWGRIKDQIALIFRNKAIDKRIRSLSQTIANPQPWANLSDEEKEMEVRRIASVRHAIERMKRMKN